MASVWRLVAALPPPGTPGFGFLLSFFVTLGDFTPAPRTRPWPWPLTNRAKKMQTPHSASPAPPAHQEQPGGPCGPLMPRGVAVSISAFGFADLLPLGLADNLTPPC